MGMKLLNISEAKSREQLDIAGQQLRLVELDALIQNKRKELEALDRDYVSSMSEHGKNVYEQEALWKAKLNSLEKEVESLEERRRIALVPLEEREKELDTRESALSQREETTRIKESDLEYKKEQMTNRLDDISEREQTAKDYILELKKREGNVIVQEKDIELRQAAVLKVMRDASDDKKKMESELTARAAVLKGKETIVSEREATVNAKEKELANREARLLDRYRTLQRAITETNLKNNVSPQNTTRNGGKRNSDR